MAVLIVVAVHDRALDGFMRPFFVPSVGMAIRSFQDEVNRKSGNDAMISMHPEDYDLYQLGSWDEDNGVFTNECKQIAMGKQCVIKGDA